MNLNVSTSLTLVNSMVNQIFTVLLQLQMCLYLFPVLGMHAECSKLQENVYFMGSISSRYQSGAPKVIKCLVLCYFLREGIMYP